MTKEQAAQILDQAISQIQTTRANHDTLKKALGVLLSSEKSNQRNLSSLNERPQESMWTITSTHQEFPMAL
jgi:autonomous glycyl radical cofactor GrcA